MVSFRAFLVNNRQVAASASDCHQAPPRTIKNHQEHHLCRSFRRKFLQFSCCLRWLVPHPGQGRASVSSHQKTAGSRQGALPGTCQEHRAAAHAVCTVQSVDGATPAVHDAGMSAPTCRQMAAKAAYKGGKSSISNQQ